MRRPATIHRYVLTVLALSSVAAAWWGCAEAATDPTGATSVTASVASSSGTGGGSGVGGITNDGGGGSDACITTDVKAEPVTVDLVFLIDKSFSMGVKWEATTSALTTFFNDPLSEGIGAGMLYMPTVKATNGVSYCDGQFYSVLDVPIAALPDNAFALTNSFPAVQAGSTPVYAALTGALLQATAYQDAHPTHKVNVVVVTDGGTNGCPPLDNIDDIAALAKSARNYNGVLTFVIGMEGATISNLDKIAAAGGTTAAYDLTQDISQFSAAMAEIRTGTLACAFGLPPPPDRMQLDPDQVNVTYTPGGTDEPVTLPRADDLADCGDQPGWYYDSNLSPTKIIICPASCTTIQNDTSAAVSVAFGCQSVLN